jgi:hypothetical protein
MMKENGRGCTIELSWKIKESVMSRFDERFENHGIHKDLENIFTLVNDILQEQNLADELIEIERIRQITLVINEMLANCDPNLVSIGNLDSINNSINQTYNNIHNYRGGRNITYLHNANNQLDSILPSLTAILRPIVTQDIEGIRKSIVSFRSFVTQHLRYSEEEFSKIESVKLQLEEGLNQVASTIEIQKGRLDSAIAEYQQQFSQAEETRREQYSQVEEARREQFINFENENKKNIDKSEVDRKSDLRKKEKERVDQYELIVNGMRESSKEYLKSLSDDITYLREDYVKNASSSIDTLDDYKKKAAQSLNMISISSMAGGYKTVADDESKSRTLWRWVTMIAMSLLVVASVWSFLHPFNNGSILIEIARRVFVAGTFATVAGYSARQAKMHHDVERKYRKMELELTALNPYLAELEDSKRKEILGNMAGVFFGKSDVGTDHKKTTEPEKEASGNLIEVSKLLEFVQALLPTKK